ncbi:uncharacterized protein LOC122398440 [Colletes gigas]|uniref:uncharacterized protein LOC122398440 n=1 Tax=Colletes gigas TaxID=935657 RepID=UPI001C9B6D8A|nr:uncharacterized protein LOC122398440 [Colletes gigas]
MLCCVSRRAVAETDLISLYDQFPSKVQFVESEKIIEVDRYTESDVAPILMPCAICARTFMPQSLEKHTRICERSTGRKRKPFDSSKQRIQGTELAEFLPRQERRRQDDKSCRSRSWKQTHDEFLRAIRAARCELEDTTMQKQSSPNAPSSAPTRANEQGVCPTCNRHFGIKAYDRHVAWCKERVTRVTLSPATNIAKERLEARMRYRAPSLKNRRQTNREKYSPGSVVTLNSGNKVSPTLTKAKETVSAPNCVKGNDSPNKQKPFVVRRSGQTKETSSPIGPMKSRAIDRTNRLPEDESGPLAFRPAPPVKRTSHLPVPPLKHKTLEEFDDSQSQKLRIQPRTRHETLNCRSKQETRHLHSARSQKSNIVSARSQGKPKLNDVSINVDVMAMTVKPCSIHKGHELTTWKKISQEKDQTSNESKARGSRLNNQKKHSVNEDQPVNVAVDLVSEDAPKETSKTSRNLSPINWPLVTPRLNRTYSFKKYDSSEEMHLESHRRWPPVRHSPRVEFCLGDLERVSRLHSSIGAACSRELEENQRSKNARGSSKKEVEEESEYSEIKNECLESERFETTRSNILEKKRLRSPAYALNDLETVHSEMNLLGENENGLSETRDESILRCVDLEFSGDLASQSGDAKGEGIALCEGKESDLYPDEFQDLIVEKDDAIAEREAADIDNLKEEMESDVRSIAEPFKDELECSAMEPEYNDDLAMFCNIESNLIEMEAEPLLMIDVLRPNRSSTPFDDVENCCKTDAECNSKRHENFKEESCSVDEWKLDVDVERGTELLYRVEPEDLDPSRIHDEVQELEKTNFEGEAISKCSSNYPKQDNNVSSTVSPEVHNEEQVGAQEQLRKDIGSQTNICKCSFKSFKREESIQVDQLCNNFVEERNTRLCQTIMEECSEMQVASRKIDSKETDEDCKVGTKDDRDLDTRSIVETEEVQEIYKNCRSNNFDYDSDNADAVNAMKTAEENDKIDVRNLRSIVLSESRVKLKTSSTSRSTLKSRRSKELEMEGRILESRNIESVEVETIEEFGTRNRSIRFRILPEIKGATVEVKKNYGEAETINAQTYWEKASKASKNRLINLDPPYQGASRFLKRNPKVRILPPVPSASSLIKCRNLTLPLRPVWSNYVRRRPDFNLVLSGRTGKDYDPFLLAEQQMNDLLSDASEQSVTDSPPIEQNRKTSFPLSHSSAFVKYPYQPSPSRPEKRSSLIAPPTEFDDLATDFSSDSTETNSLSREVFLKDSKDFKESLSKSDVEKRSPVRELGRRVIIDRSRALGGEVEDAGRGSRTEKARKILDKVSPKVIRPTVNRSFSVRAASAPKMAATDRKTSNGTQDSKESSQKCNDGQRSSNAILNSRNNNYVNLSGSNLSLSSIVSSDVDIKRSNSVFDELMTSFEDENDGSFPSLKSLLKNDSLSVTSPVRGRQRGDQASDEDLSSPESYKRQDHSKLSGDSAYSSLNRKYSHHGRSTNDVAGRLEEDSRHQRRHDDGVATSTKCKMSKFCHECGSKFPETAKFCCECGIRRLVL